MAHPSLHRTSSPLGLAVLAMCCCSLIHAEARTNAEAIIGRVVDGTTGGPVAGATVTLAETGDRRVTAGDGVFSFASVRPGRYTLRCHHLAYRDVERPVTAPSAVDTLVLHLASSLLPAEEVIVRSAPHLPDIDALPAAVLPAEQLQATPAVTPPDAFRGTPGVALMRDGIWETTVAIRGLSRASVVTLIDHVRMETATDLAGALSLINVRDLDRVEVIKSPGSVLFGSGALGGIVHLLTRQPGFSEEPSLHMSAATEVTGVNHGVAHYLSAEGSTSQVGVRLSAGVRNAGNVQTPVGTMANSGFHDFSFAGSVLVRTVDEQSLSVSYQRVQAEDTGIPGGSPFPAAAVARYVLARRELVRAEYRLPNLTPLAALVTVRAAYQEIDRNVELLQGATVLTPHAVHATTSLQASAELIPSASDVLTVGIDVWQRALDSQRERTTAARITGERPIPLARCLSAGAFAENVWHPMGGPLTVTIGGRYDQLRMTNEEAWNPTYVATGAGLDRTPSGRVLLWNASSVRNASWSVGGGVSWAVDRSVDLTAHAATAFRSPSLEERYQYIDLGSVVRLGNPDLLPERSVACNLGGRLRVPGGLLQGDLFLNLLHDLVAEVPDVFEGRAALRNRNIGKAHLYGWELRSDLTPVPWLALGATLAYVRGEDLHLHTNLAQIPPITGSVEVRYLRQAIGTIAVRLDVAGRQGSPGPGEPETPGYGVLSVDVATAPLACGPLAFTIKAGVQNALDKEYRNHLSTLRGGVRAEPGTNVSCSLLAAF